MLLRRLFYSTSQSIKKIAAVVLALCVTISLVQTSVLLSFANNSQKQMLHVQNFTGKFGIKVAETVIPGANYTVEFKYKLVSGSIDGADTNGVGFRTYYKQADSGQGAMQNSNHGGAGKPFTSKEVGTNTMKVSFDITSDTAIDNTYYIGFYGDGSYEFYIADMVMYKTDDTNKNNLLPESPTSADWYKVDSGYYSQNLPSGFAYEDYIDSYFSNNTSTPSTTKQMLHIQNFTGKLGLKVTGLEIGGEYTLRFRYHNPTANGISDVFAAENSASVAIYYKNGETGQAAMQYANRAQSGNAKNFASYTIDTEAKTVEVSFKLDQVYDLIDDIYYIGFYGSGNYDFYVADMLLYKNSDANKTNLLPAEPTAADWCKVDGNGYFSQNLPSNCAYSNLNEEYFPEEGATEPAKQMLHVQNFTGKLGLKVTGLESGGEYTLKFRYHNPTANGLSDVFAAENSASVAVYYKQATSGQAAMQYSNRAQSGHAKNFNSYVINAENKTAQVSFKVNDDEIIEDTYYIGFYGSGNYDFYIADMVLYKNSDANKTNLLPEEPTAADWYKVDGNGYFSANIPTNCGYEDLIEDYFKVEEEIPESKAQMLHIQNFTGKLGLKVEGNVVAGETYTVEYRYKLTTGTLDDVESNGIAFRAFYKEADSGQAAMQYSNHGAGNKPFDSYDISEGVAKITYTIAPYMTSDTYYVGFLATGEYDIYVADMVMYKSDDLDKTNLLPKHPKNDDWYKVNGDREYSQSLPLNCEYVDYDVKFFPEKPQMLHISNFTGKVGLKVAGILTPGETYTVRFNHKFINGTLKPSIVDATDYTSFCVFYKSENAGNGAMQYSNHGGDNKPFVSIKNLNNDTVEYTFKLTTDTAIDKTYYIGFYGNGNYEMYVANMVMYKTDDVSMKNLLSSPQIESDWYSVANNTYNQGLPAGCELVDLDNSYFEPLKQMINFQFEGRLGYKIGDVNTVKPGKYTVEFDYVFKKGSLQTIHNAVNNGAVFVVYGEQKDEENTIYKMNYIIGNTNTPFKSITHIDNARMQYTFEMTQEIIDSCVGDLRIGFVTGGDYEFYLANMVMYESNDIQKTNLISDIGNLDNWMYGVSRYGNKGISSEDSLELYDPSLFDHKEYIPPEMMFHYYQTNDLDCFLGVQLEKGAIKAGVEYTASFKYHMDDGNLDDRCSFSLMYNNAKTAQGRVIDKVMRVARKQITIDYSANLDTQFKDGANAEYTFTLDGWEVEDVSDFFVGFCISAGEAPVDLYVYDFKLYETKDTTKTSIVGIDNHTSNPKLWVGLWGINDLTLGVREYLPYDSSLFVPTSQKNIYVDGSFNGDDGEWWNVNDIVEEMYEVGTATVKGRVTDQDGNPIANARLLLKGAQNLYTAISDTNGYYSFNNVPVDLYELYILDSNNKEIFTGFSNFFNAGDTATVNIQCDSSKATFSEPEKTVGSLKGAVYTADLKTIGGIKVYMRGFGEFITDKDGAFEFKEVPVGDYELYTVLSDGSEYIFRTVSIKENVELSVKLKYDASAVSVNNGGPSSIIWVIVATGAVLVIGGGVVALLIIKRQKKLR